MLYQNTGLLIIVFAKYKGILTVNTVHKHSSAAQINELLDLQCLDEYMTSESNDIGWQSVKDNSIWALYSC